MEKEPRKVLQVDESDHILRMNSIRKKTSEMEHAVQCAESGGSHVDKVSRMRTGENGKSMTKKLDLNSDPVDQSGQGKSKEKQNVNSILKEEPRNVSSPPVLTSVKEDTKPTENSEEGEFAISLMLLISSYVLNLATIDFDEEEHN